MKRKRKIRRDIGDNRIATKQSRRISRDISDHTTNRQTLKKKTAMSVFVDKGLELWTRKFIAQSLWRFRGEYDADDLLSEAWIVLDHITKRHGDVAINNLMALYQTSLKNRFHRLAAKNRYCAENSCSIDEALEIETPNRPIVACLVDAPIDVRDAITALLEIDPALLTEKFTPYRECYDRRFHRVIDNMPKDIAKKIRDFLRGNDYVC